MRFTFCLLIGLTLMMMVAPSMCQDQQWQSGGSRSGGAPWETLLAQESSSTRVGFVQSTAERLPTFFVGRVQYGTNRGGDCGDVGRNMVQLVARVTTVPVSSEKKLALTDSTLFDTPFLFMNGHDDFVFSDTELENLRTYLDHGGFLFASGCCTNPPFPRAWRRELSRVFPGEEVTILPYDHPIYRTFYRIERVRNLHENKDVHLEALFHQGRMVAVMCENGLCCAFAMDNSCNVGRGVSPEDGKQLALNIAIYAMTH